MQHEKITILNKLIEVEQRRIKLVLESYQKNQNPKIPLICYLWNDISKQTPECNELQIAIDGDTKNPKTLNDFTKVIPHFAYIAADTKNPFSETASSADSSYAKNALQLADINQVGTEDASSGFATAELILKTTGLLKQSISEQTAGELDKILRPTYQLIDNRLDLEIFAKQIILALIETHTTLNKHQKRLDTLATYFKISENAKGEVILREKDIFPLTLQTITDRTGWLQTLIDSLDIEIVDSLHAKIFGKKHSQLGFCLSSVIKILKIRYDELLLNEKDKKTAAIEKLFAAIKAKNHEALSIIDDLQLRERKLQELCQNNTALITQLNAVQADLTAKLIATKTSLAIIDAKQKESLDDAALLMPNISSLSSSLDVVTKAINAQRDFIFKLAEELETARDKYNNDITELEQKTEDLKKFTDLHSFIYYKSELAKTKALVIQDPIDQDRIEILEKNIDAIKRKHPDIEKTEHEFKNIYPKLAEARTNKSKVEKLLADSKALILDETSPAAIQNTAAAIDSMQSALNQCSDRIENLTSNLATANVESDKASAAIRLAQSDLKKMQELTDQLQINNQLINDNSAAIHNSLIKLKAANIKIEEYANVGKAIAIEINADDEFEKINLRRMIALSEVIQHINEKSSGTAAEDDKKFIMVESLAAISSISTYLRAGTKKEISDTAWKKAKEAAKIYRSKKSNFSKKVAAFFQKTASTKILEAADKNKQSLAELHTKFDSMKQRDLENDNLAFSNTALSADLIHNQMVELNKNKAKRQKSQETLLLNITANKQICFNLTTACDLISRILHIDNVVEHQNLQNYDAAGNPSSFKNKAKRFFAKEADHIADTARGLRSKVNFGQEIYEARAAIIEDIDSDAAPLFKLLHKITHSISIAKEGVAMLLEKEDERIKKHDEELLAAQQKYVDLEPIIDRFDGFLKNIEKLANAIRSYQAALKNLENATKLFQQKESSATSTAAEVNNAYANEDTKRSEEMNLLTNQFIVAQLNFLSILRTIQTDNDHILITEGGMKERLLKFLQDTLFKNGMLESAFIAQHKEFLQRCQDGWDSFKYVINNIVDQMISNLKTLIPDLNVKKITDDAYLKTLLTRFPIEANIPATGKIQQSLGVPKNNVAAPVSSESEEFALQSDSAKTSHVTNHHTLFRSLPAAEQSDEQDRTNKVDHYQRSKVGLFATAAVSVFIAFYAYIADIVSFLGDFLFDL